MTMRPDAILPPLTFDMGVGVLHHGERDDLDPEHPQACLCGRYLNYMECPDAFELGDMTVHPTPDPLDRPTGRCADEYLLFARRNPTKLAAWVLRSIIDELIDRRLTERTFGAGQADDHAAE